MIACEERRESDMNFGNRLFLYSRGGMRSISFYLIYPILGGQKEQFRTALITITLNLHENANQDNGAMMNVLIIFFFAALNLSIFNHWILRKKSISSY